MFPQDRLRNGAFVPKELALQMVNQFGKGATIIGIPRSQAPSQSFPVIVHDHMPLEPEKPPGGGLPPSRLRGKDAMLSNAAIGTNDQFGRIHKTDARTGALLGSQIGTQRDQHSGYPMHQSRVTHQSGKFLPHMHADIPQREVLERSVARLMKQDQDGHDFTGM
jgi:hypothetical protein